MAKKNISKQAQSKLIKKFVTKSGKPRFFKEGKRLPDKAGAVRFKNQQIAINRYRFGDGRFVGKNVQSTIVNNPELKDILPNKVLSKNPEFFDVTDNETALDILDSILSESRPQRKEIVTFIQNDELHPRDDFKFKINQPIAIYELIKELNDIKPKKGVKLKVIKEDGSEVIGREATKYLSKWNIEKFEEIKRKYPDAVGGVIKYPHKFVSPYLIIDLRLVDDKDIDVFNSEPRRRGEKGRRINYDRAK